MKKILLKKWDPEKSKTKQTDIRNKENKKRSRTEEASTGTDKSHGNDKSKKKSARYGYTLRKSKKKFNTFKGNEWETQERQQLLISDWFKKIEANANRDVDMKSGGTPAQLGLRGGDKIEAPEEIPVLTGLSDCDGIEAFDLQSRNSFKFENETSCLRAELRRKEKEVMEIKRKLLWNEICSLTQKQDGKGDIEGQLSLEDDLTNSFKYPEISVKGKASHKSNVIEIVDGEDNKTEYKEQIPGDVEEQNKNGNKTYNYVCVEMETILASNSFSRDITQIGACKGNSVCNAEAQFFKAIAPKNLDYYLENYKLDGDLLQNLHMQKNNSGKFEFRKQFEIPDEGRVVPQCVSEENALEELSSYLTTVRNCIIVSLNEENIKLLVNRMKVLGITNKRIRMDSVKGFCTWSSYLCETGASKEDLDQEFEDWYEGHVDSGYCKEPSSETVRKHADIVANMVHNSIVTLFSLPHILVKASRPIESLHPNQRPEEGEPTHSEIQYLELFSSLRYNCPVIIHLRKLQTYDISSEEEDGDKRSRNEQYINRGLLAKTGRYEHKDQLDGEQESETDEGKLHIDDAMENRQGYLKETIEIPQDEHSIGNQYDRNALKCRYCQNYIKTYEEKIEHILKCNPSYEDRSRCSFCRKQFVGNYLEPANISRNEHIINTHNPNNRDQPPILPLEFQCQKCYLWFPSLPRKLLHGCSVINPQTPLYLKCQQCKKSFKTYEKKTAHVAKCSKCSICNKLFRSVVNRNDHIIAKHNPNNFDQLPILPLELQCQKCYKWFRKIIHPTQQCFMENPKIPVFLECQKCKRSFHTYQEKIAHTSKCISKIANHVPNMLTKEASSSEIINIVSTAKSKTNFTNTTKDKTIPGHNRIYRIEYMDHLFKSK